MDRVDDIVVDEYEMGMREKVCDVIALSSEEVIDANDLVILD